MNNLAIVDVETTGLNPQREKIIEIAILHVDNGTITHRFHSLVNPHQSLNPLITSITGITQSDLSHAPSFDQIADQVYSLLQTRIFTAHNVRFDYGFIKIISNKLVIIL